MSMNYKTTTVKINEDILNAVQSKGFNVSDICRDAVNSVLISSELKTTEELQTEITSNNKIKELNLEIEKNKYEMTCKNINSLCLLHNQPLIKKIEYLKQVTLKDTMSK